MRRTSASSDDTGRYGVVAVCLLVVLGGCVGAAPTASGPASFVESEGVTLAPGETGTVSITFRNVGELYPTDGKKDGVVLLLGTDNVTATPRMYTAVQTRPPYWLWESVRSPVTVTIPVRVTREASPGTYRFGFVAWNNTKHNHTNGARGTVTVTVVTNTSGS